MITERTAFGMETPRDNQCFFVRNTWTRTCFFFATEQKRETVQRASTQFPSSLMNCFDLDSGTVLQSFVCYNVLYSCAVYTSTTNRSWRPIKKTTRMSRIFRSAIGVIPFKKMSSFFFPADQYGRERVKKQIYWKERERALIVSSPYANDLIRPCNEFDLLQQKRRRFLLIIFDGGVVQFIQLINNNEGVKTMLEKNETNSVGNA